MPKKHTNRARKVDYRKRRSMRLESLESRQLMAASLDLSQAGVLAINAGADAADVRVFEAFGQLVVSRKDASGAVQHDAFKPVQVKKIVFTGSERADTFVNRTAVTDVIYGRGGDDVLTGGQGASRIEGGAGRDTIDGGAGNDTIRGGSGDDTIRGGTGNDQIDGDEGHDSIHGDDGHDTLRGGSGNDVVNGGAGNDTICGGEGEDTLRGNDGDDQVHGEAGDDYLYGGSGNDKLSGGGGNDRLYGDDYMGAQGVDHLLGGDGEDWLYGGGGKDTLEGQGARDHLYGGGGNDKLVGGYGDDELFGGDGVDELIGGPGRDFFDGQAMRDLLRDVSREDTVQKTLHVDLNVDTVRAVQASDGQGRTNEVYFMVAGRQEGAPFGPVREHPYGRDSWSLDTGDRANNISLWHGNLKPGQSIDLVVSMVDSDDAIWDALAAFGKRMVDLLPAIPSVLTGNFAGAIGTAVETLTRGINDAIQAGVKGADDLLGVFLVHIENVDGKISTTWRASSQAIMYEVTDDAAGDYANFRTWCTDGEFSLRTSVRET